MQDNVELDDQKGQYGEELLRVCQDELSCYINCCPGSPFFTYPIRMIVRSMRTDKHGFSDLLLAVAFGYQLGHPEFCL